MPSEFKLSDLTVEYQAPNTNVTAVRGVSMNIPTGGYTIGIVGESGSGKTTLGMSLLNFIEAPGKITSGSLEYDGKNVLAMSKSELRNYRWKEVAMVYQSAMNSLNPVKPILNPIVEVIKQHSDATAGEAEDKARKLLAEVGIQEKRLSDYPYQFSGGMRQRVVIALALALSPKLLIADEPTSALDVVVQSQILMLLKKEIRSKGLSLIFITHEILLLCGLVENVAVMYGGEIVEQGTLAKILTEPGHPYTEMLLSSLLTMDSEDGILNQRESKRKDLVIVSIHSSPKGCIYADRCKYVFDKCRMEKPLLKQLDKERLVACHKYS